MAGKLCPHGQSRDSACDVGGKQPVPGGLVGRTLMSQCHQGQGSESTAERCWQCCPVPVIAVGQEVRANSHWSEVKVRNNLKVSGCYAWMQLSVPILRNLGGGKRAA